MNVRMLKGYEESSLSFQLCIPNNANQITELATLPTGRVST